MNRSKRLLIARLAITAGIIGGVGRVCRAGRPLTIDDAAPVETGKIQIETGIGFLKNSNTHHFDFPLTLAYGLVSGLEVGGASGGQFEERNDPGENQVGGLSDSFLHAKWRFINDEKRDLAFTLTPAITFPTADHKRGLGSGKTDTDLTLIVTKGFGRFALDCNLGFTFVDDGKDAWHYGVAARRQLTEDLWLVGEIFAVTAQSGSTSVSADIGVQRQVAPGLVLDADIGTALHDAPDLTATIGLTWVF